MVKQESILKALKEDVKSADVYRAEIEEDINRWEKEYKGEKYGNEQEGKSKIVSKDIMRQDEWQHSSVKEPFVSGDKIVVCTPYSHEDAALAEQTETVLNYQFTKRFPRYNFMTLALKVLSMQGTLLVKTGWLHEYEDVEEKILVPKIREDGTTTAVEEIVKKRKTLVNAPDAVITSVKRAYIDPTCNGDIENAQFVAYEYETDLSSLRKANKYKNLDKLAKESQKTSDTTYMYDDESKDFEFKDEPRKKLTVVEYAGNFDIEGTGITQPIVASWVGDTLIELKSNPYPDEEIPFLLTKRNMTPFKIHGTADAELIGDNQKLSTAIKRSFIDNMANSNNAQKGIRVNALDAVNRKRFLNNKHFEFQGSKADFYEGSYNTIPSSAFSVLEMVNNESESLTGVKGFSGGITGNGLGTTATSARGALDATSIRRLDIVRNIAENLIKPLMRKWASYNSKFLSEEEVVRITNKPYVPTDPTDPKRLFDINIEVTTAEDDAKRIQDISFILQTLGQTLPQHITTLFSARIAKLSKMPDIAEEILNYKPEPDPLQQEIQKLQIEKLRAEIDERKSRAIENGADLRLKTAKAVLEEAKGESVMADTDLKDLEFTEKASGIQFNQDMEKKNFDRITQEILQSNNVQ